MTVSNSRSRGIGMIGVIVAVVSVLILLILAWVVIGALGASRRTANRMKSNVNVRSIGTGLIMYATANDDHFPNSPGDNATPDDPTTPGPAGTEAGALMKLIERPAIDSITLNNPIDPASLATGVTDEAELRGGTDYWILSTGNDAYFNHNLSTVPLVADKNTGTPTAPASLWSKSGPWQGGVFWADGHTTSESSPVVETFWPDVREKGVIIKPGHVNPGDELFSGTVEDAVLEMK